MTLQIVATKPRDRRQFRWLCTLARSPRETGIQGKEEWVLC